MIRRKHCRLFLCLLMVLLSATLPLSGCVRVTGAETDPTPGTYRLTECTESDRENSKESRKDLQSERGMDAYIIITAEEYGFYVHRDAETPLSCRQVRLDRQYDAKNDAIPCSITITDGVRLSKTLEVQTRRKTLTTSETVGDVLTSETYKRVSKATDLSYASAETETMLTYVGWNYFRFDGAYDLFCVRGTKRSDEGYIYRHVVIDAAARTATIYEAKTDTITPESHTLPILLVDIDGDGSADPMSPKEGLKIGDELFCVTSADYLYRILDDTGERVVMEMESFRCLRHECDDAYRAELIEAYRKSVGEP